MSSENYHEPLELLSEETRNLHRAIITLIEELEAVDWYQQRAQACSDPDLAAVLVHNRDEEVEHAMMTLEWIRRNFPVFDQEARTYLFTDGPITEIEEEDEANGAAKPPESRKSPSLGIGSLKNAAHGEEH